MAADKNRLDDRGANARDPEGDGVAIQIRHEHTADHGADVALGRRDIQPVGAGVGGQPGTDAGAMRRRGSVPERTSETALMISGPVSPPIAGMSLAMASGDGRRSKYA